MRIVGLTGGISTGKSTVSLYLKSQGFEIIDLDVIAREVTQRGRPAFYEIITMFGSQFIDVDGQLDRTKLGKLIFADKEARKKLDGITHPRIKAALFWLVLWHAFCKGTRVLILDVPLLFETKLNLFCAVTVVVNANPDTQLMRLMKRDNIMAADARKKIAAQMPLADKVKRATYVLDNSGTPEELKKQVDGLIPNLRKPSIVPPLRTCLFAVIAAPVWCVARAFACF